MAQVVATGVFNALAFAGAGFLSKMLDKNGYGEEMKRHNLAMEDLTKPCNKWNEQQVLKREEIFRKRHLEKDRSLLRQELT